MVLSLDLRRYRNIVVLTGAGISVASGVRPFRGPNGIWNEWDIERCATRTALEQSPQLVWQAFGPLRKQLQTTQPNAAHRALARFEQSLSKHQRFTLITQNIDGLHQLAGTRNLVEFHGSLRQSRCSDDECEQPSFVDQRAHTETLPTCPTCGNPLRPDIVLFEEAIPTWAEAHAKRSLRECDFFLAVGTSGTVFPAAAFARTAQMLGARTMLVNLEPHSEADSAFEEQQIGRAEELLPTLLGVA
ncbi:SIR2 family NAD-dependent protein deacylase [Herpetosiphon giganteus]|uniref:SIR2 family NAD-dependent protein deacylase n=1 Tax=Herpetosiphon giganteus TaxID=2029754 RepID=UPI001958A7A2|nr:NAD-dependent deacylase [Herpetosiphon giganteus]MBM7843990.1 NAD-dependent deacetylase [Herpetosiphon giganteus]